MHVTYEYPYSYFVNINEKNSLEFIRDSLIIFEYSKIGYVLNKHWLLNSVKKWHLKLIYNKTSESRIIGLGDSTAYVLNDDILYYLNNNIIETHKIGKVNAIKYPSLIGDKLILEFDNKINIFKDGKLISAQKQIFAQNSVNMPIRNYRFYWTTNGTYIFNNRTLFELAYTNGRLEAKVVFENLPFATIESIYYKPDLEKYFFGSSTKGLFILNKPLFQITKLSNALEYENIFYAQALVNDKILANNYLIDKNGNSEKTLMNALNTNLLISNNKVYYAPLKQGKNIEIYDIQNKTIKTIISDDIQNIACILYSNFDSTIYVANHYSVGKIENNKFKWLGRIKNNFIHSILPYNKDTIFVATRQGIYYLNIQTKKFTTIIGNYEFRAIYCDKYQNYWFGTYDNGYYLLNKKGIVKLPIDKGNRLKTVHSFYLDNKNRLWMSTNNGLVAANLAELLNFQKNKDKSIFYKIFTKEDGLATNEFNGGCHPAYIQLPDGSISYPSLDGLVRFTPEKIKMLDAQNNIYIDNVYSNLSIPKNINNLIFENDAKQITFEISSPFFGKKDEINFAYKLGNENNNWLNTTNKIVFNELPYGHYVLYLKLLGNEKSLKEIRFYIEPFFYQTVWFWVFIVFALLLSLFGIFWYRLKLSRDKNQYLGKLVAQKTNELNNNIIILNSTIEKLEKSDSELSSLAVVQSKILNLVLHDLKSPIQFLKFQVEDAIKFFNEKNEKATSDSLSSLNRGILEISHFSNSFFDWIYFQRNGIKPIKSNFKVSKLFNNLNKIYNSKNSSNKLIFECNETEIFSDQNIIETILRNLISNANKNTINGEINISCSVENQNTKIIITDSGKGFNPTKIEQIDKILNNKADINKLVGFGYKIILELVKLINADIKIINNNGKGTIVILTIEQDIY